MILFCYYYSRSRPKGGSKRHPCPCSPTFAGCRRSLVCAESRELFQRLQADWETGPRKRARPIFMPFMVPGKRAAPALQFPRLPRSRDKVRHSTCQALCAAAWPAALHKPPTGVSGAPLCNRHFHSSISNDILLALASNPSNLRDKRRFSEAPKGTALQQTKRHGDPGGKTRHPYVSCALMGSFMAGASNCLCSPRLKELGKASFTSTLKLTSRLYLSPKSRKVSALRTA